MSIFLTQHICLLFFRTIENVLVAISNDAIRDVNIDVTDGVKNIFDKFQKNNQELQRKSIKYGTRLSHSFNNQLIPRLKTRRSDLVRKYKCSKNMLETRERQFKDRIKKLSACFDEQINYLCREEKLDLTASLSVMRNLSEPIHLFSNNFHPVREVSLQQQNIASLILKVSIHLTMKSPILIIDSLDYSISRNVIDSLYRYICKLHRENKIQVMFMFIDAPEEMSDVSSVHLMWDESVVRMGREWFHKYWI